jgi:hypothetical protein
MILTCAIFCRVTNEGVILMSLFTVQGHIGSMTYNYYYRWIRMIYHATTLGNFYVSVLYQLDMEWCPPSLGMATFVVTLLVRMMHG